MAIISSREERSESQEWLGVSTEGVPDEILEDVTEDMIVSVDEMDIRDLGLEYWSGEKDIEKGEVTRLPSATTKGRKGSKWPQVCAAIAANMGAFAFGTVLAWSSTGIASLEDSEAQFRDLSTWAKSWIGSISLLGAVAGCPIAGYGLGKFGRRKSMLLLTLPFIIGWILIAGAQNLFMIYAGRFITGVAGGAFSITAPVFTAETADPKIRGALGSFFDLKLSFGMLYIYIIGDYVSWRYQAAACALIPIAFHFIMLFVPESPRFLLEKSKTTKAEKALRWLKGAKKYPHVVQRELSILAKSVDEARIIKVTLRDTLRRPILKPTILLIGIMFLTTMSGVDAVVAYTVEIFESAGAKMDPHLSTIIIGVTQVLSTIPAALIVDHAGRRILLMISDIFMFVSLVIMGGYFYLRRTDILILGMSHQDLTWVPLAALISFVVAYSFGFGPLSMMMIGEILPNHMKGLTSCIVLMSRWILAFAVTNSFESLKLFLDDHGTYWFFATVCFFGTFYVFFCIPETKGKSLDEIQVFFVKRGKSPSKCKLTESFPDLSSPQSHYKV